MKKQILVTLIGTDGSGKTSTADALFDLLHGADYQVKQVWCGAESYLMRPVRGILKLIRKKKAKVGSDRTSYKMELAEKEKLSKQLGVFQCFYIRLILLDYSLQYRWKMWRYRKAKVLILDRYFFDVAVNLAITLGWDEHKLIHFIQKHCWRYRFPDIYGFVYVRPEVSMQRKDDIPDIDYIELRLRYYRMIARRYGFDQIDGEASIEVNASAIFDKVRVALDSKYVHYVHSNNNDIGGADYCLFRMAEAVNEYSQYRTAISLRLPTKIVDLYQDAGIPVYMADFCRPQLSRGWLALLALPFKGAYSIYYFWNLFRRQSPDVVHLNDLYDFLPAIAAKLVGIPIVYHIRMIRVNKPEIRIFSWLLRNLSRISFSVSNAVRQTYFGSGPYDTEHHLAEVVYDWPDPKLVYLPSEIERPGEFLPFNQVVVMVGRLEQWKGQHVFIRAIELLASRAAGVGFFIVGGKVKGTEKEKYADEILERAESLGVIYLGQRSDVASILLHADISVHASVTPDPFPGVVLESLLSMSATVAVDAGGAGEMIRHETDGLRYPAGDAEALARCIERLLINKDEAREYSVSGRTRILNMVDKEKILQQIFKLYKKI